MAIGTPTQVGTNTSQVSTHTTIAASGCVIPANSLVVAVVGHSNGSTASGDPSGISDGTNNYVKDASDTRSTTTNCSIWSFYDTAGATRTITATIPTSTMSWIYVFTISGAATSAFKDVTDNATGSGGTQASTVTTSANVAQADSVAMWAMFRSTSSTWTTGYPPTNYTSLANVVNATRTRGFAAAFHKTLTAGATESAACSLPATADWAAPLVVYKGVSAANKAIVPAAITASSAMTSAMTKLASITPAAVNATSAMSVTVRDVVPVVPSALTATSTVATKVVKLAAVKATISATSPTNATVTKPGGASIVPAAIVASSVIGTTTITALRPTWIAPVVGTQVGKSIDRGRTR